MFMSIYIYIYTYICMCVYIYIYICDPQCLKDLIVEIYMGSEVCLEELGGY